MPEPLTFIRSGRFKVVALPPEPFPSEWGTITREQADAAVIETLRFNDERNRLFLGPEWDKMCAERARELRAARQSRPS